MANFEIFLPVDKNTARVAAVGVGSVATRAGLLALDSVSGQLLLSQPNTLRFAPIAGARPRFKLLIYYGYPSLVNGSTSNDEAAQYFSEWDVVVFGANLQLPSHPDHANLVQIISKIHTISPSTLIYGYIDLGVTTNDYPIDQMKTFTDQWKVTGADGIFWDDAGYDFGTTRIRQTTMITYARSVNMTNFMNAFDPNDIFSSNAVPIYNPTGAGSILGSNDLFLLESFPYNSSFPSGWIDRATLLSRVDTARYWRNIFGTRIAATSPVDYVALNDSEKQYLRYLLQAIGFVFSLDYYGDSALNFSAFGGNSNLIYKGNWDLEMARAGMNGWQAYFTDASNTIDRHDYNVKVYYEDGVNHSYNSPLSTSPLFPQISGGQPPAGILGRIAFGPSGIYVYDNGVSWNPI